MLETEEIWLPAKGYEDIIEVSNFGKIRTLSREIIQYRPQFGRNVTIKLKPRTRQIYGTNSDGYVSAKVKNKNITIHRLVVTTFIPNPNNLPQINHIDGNKTNNNVNNLEWVSNRENTSHGKIKPGKSSIYTGVTWDKARQKWKASIQVNGVNINIGRFTTELDAHMAYQSQLKINNLTNKYSYEEQKSINKERIRKEV